jgi:hypothetical protein
MRVFFVMLLSIVLSGCPTSSSPDTGIATDVPYLGYCPEAAFPTAWARACTSPTDCYVASHVRDCCGGQVLMGISTTERGRFDVAEAAVLAACAPSCECLSGTVLEDGTVVSDPAIIFADCVAGRCQARFPTR